MEDNGEKKCRNEKDSPILGDIESNFTRISGENKKKMQEALAAKREELGYSISE